MRRSTLRIEAVNTFSNERATTEDAAYLRGLYTRADNDRLKEAIINAIGRIGGQENDQWILTSRRIRGAKPAARRGDRPADALESADRRSDQALRRVGFV